MENRNTVSSLMKVWISLLDEEKIKSTDENEDYLGLLMLLETAHMKAKNLSSSYLDLKLTSDRLVKELELKSDEYKKLQIENIRLESTPCQKCSSLEAEMKHLRKKASEAQSRMKSIANILRLGESIEDSQSPRKNSALTLVSQMLMEESPRRKKRCLPKTNSWEETVIEKEHVQNCTTLNPENVQSQQCNLKSVSGTEEVDDAEIIISPGDVAINKSDNFLKPNLTKNITVSNKESPKHVKKKLSLNFDKVASETTKNSIEVIPETEQNSLDLNGSLAEYVKDASSELDKIWFTASCSKSIDKSNNQSQKRVSSKGETIIDVTPERTPPKKKTTWKMKEVRGPSEHAGNKKLRQMTLSLSQKQKSKEVDLSTLSGFDGGSLDSSKDSVFKKSNDDRTLHPRENLEKPLENPEEMHSDIGTNTFQPITTSTQLVDFDLVSRNEKKGNSPNYKYKRDTVRKKSERAKLEGWDCTKCAEYYAACGESSPSKVKGRMNKCSRHRDKFKPTSNTPPGFWNPIFPDTEECKEQGMYTSYHCKRGE